MKKKTYGPRVRVGVTVIVKQKIKQKVKLIKKLKKLTR